MKYLSVRLIFFLLVLNNFIDAQVQIPTGYRINQKIDLNKEYNGIDGTIQILLDDKINDTTVSFNDWGTENKKQPAILRINSAIDFSSDEFKPAIMRIVSGDNAIYFNKTLESCVASIGSMKLHEDKVSTYFLTVDLSAGAGSYNGPITKLFEIKDGDILYIDGLEFMSSLKSAWKVDNFKEEKGYQFFYITCRPDFNSPNTDFYTNYRRYFYNGKKWVYKEKIVKEFWENEDSFPNLNVFP